MNDPVIAYVLAVAAAAVAAVFWLSARSAARERDSALRRADDLEKDLAAARAKAEERGKLLERRTEEVETLRRKLQKAKKRAAGSQEERSREARRIEALEEEVETARQAAAELRSALEAAHEEMESLRRESGRRAAPGAPGEARRPQRPRDRLREQSIAEREREKATRLKKEVDELRRTVVKLKEEVKKHRGRAETNRRIYLVAKGELEAAKDKIASLMKAGARLDGASKPKRRRRSRGEEAAAEATASEATASEATASEATASEATASEA
ncbi:MAG: hypothetical protein D6729_00735, partial [Deltaproteobacteria bacterium]